MRIMVSKENLHYYAGMARRTDREMTAIKKDSLGYSQVPVKQTPHNGGTTRGSPGVLGGQGKMWVESLTVGSGKERERHKVACHWLL